MSKYILARDIPNVKKGAKVTVDSSIYCEFSGNRVYLDKFPGLLKPEEIQSELQRLINEGWIEEVKPSEGWVNIYENGYGPYYLHFTKEEAESMAHKPTPIRTVKFREVTDEH